MSNPSFVWAYIVTVGPIVAAIATFAYMGMRR